MELWENSRNDCVKAFQERQNVISVVRNKVYPFAINDLIEEVKAREAMNHLNSEIIDSLDPQVNNNLLHWVFLTLQLKAAFHLPMYLSHLPHVHHIYLLY